MSVWIRIELNPEYELDETFFLEGGLEIWYDLCIQANLQEYMEESEDADGEREVTLPAEIFLLDWVVDTLYDKCKDIDGWDEENPPFIVQDVVPDGAEVVLYA